jgi:hypothetical protein
MLNRPDIDGDRMGQARARPEPTPPEHEGVAQEDSPDNLDQTPEFDPADPEPIPEDDFDQSCGP